MQGLLGTAGASDDERKPVDEREFVTPAGQANGNGGDSLLFAQPPCW